MARSPALPVRPKLRSSEALRSGLASRVALPPTVDLSAVAAAVAEIRVLPVGTALHLDLSQCRNFDSVGLLCLLGAVSYRSRRGQDTYFRLPNDKVARHFLRSRRFPAAVDLLTNVPFRLLVGNPDRSYFGEEPAVDEPAGTVRDATAYALTYLVERRFFGFSPHQFGSDADQVLMITGECDRWHDGTLVSLLDRVLGGDPRDVSRVVLFEVLSNIAQHSGARTGVLATDIRSPALPKPEAVGRELSDTGMGSLVIALWDDGAPVISAMRDRLGRQPKQQENVGLRLDTYLLEAHGWCPVNTEYSSTWAPGASAPDPELLLATLLPNMGAAALVHGRPTDKLRPSGIGLHALYRTVVDAFAGELKVYCGQWSMAVSGAGQVGHYLAKIEFHRSSPVIEGNLVVVELPTHGT